MKKPTNQILAVFSLAACPLYGAISYSNDFESYDQATATTLGDDGWLVGANVFDSTGTNFLYNYFAFPAPNGGAAFSSVALGEGGVPQGDQQLSVYGDYNNSDQANGNRILATVFRNLGTIDAGDVGQTYNFSFDVKQGDIGGATTAFAFLKVLKTSDFSFADLAVDSADTTATGVNWTGDTLSLTIDPSWVGETMQIGFIANSSNFQPSGVFYDNLVVEAIPEPSTAVLSFLAASGLLISRKRK